MYGGDAIFINILVTVQLQPRLGPKPFSSEASTDFSFDKVFAVPQFIGNEALDVREDKIQEVEVPAPVFDEEEETNGVDSDAELEEIEPEMATKEEIIEVEIHDEENMDTESEFKVPSTAERRKVLSVDVALGNQPF